MWKVSWVERLLAASCNLLKRSFFRIQNIDHCWSCETSQYVKRWPGGALVSCNLLLVRARSWNRAQLKSQPIFKPKFYEDCWFILENAHITSPEQGSKCRIEAKIIVSGHTLCPLQTFIQWPSTVFCHLQKHFLLQGDGTLDVLDIWLFFDAFLRRAQFWVKTDCVKVEHRPPGAVCPRIFPLSCYPPTLSHTILSSHTICCT